MPISYSGGLPYKSYVAILNQSGVAAPVATGIYNTLGGAVVWSRVSQGQFKGVLNGAFTLNKTPCLIVNGVNNDSLFAFANSNTNEIDISCLTGDDDVIQNASIEIRVYP